MLRNKKITKGLSLLITMVMLLGYFTSFVYAENDQLKSAKVDLVKEASEKIEMELKKDLEKDDLVEILVYMKDQADTENVAKATRSAVSSAMTPYSTKLEVRRGVVEALRDKAEMTQMNILNYLEQEIDRGNVEEFTPYHIVNMIYVKATKEVVENISFMTEVEKIYKNKVHTLDIPEMNGEIQPSDTGIEWNVERVKADQVWNLGYDGTGIVVATIDSGIDWTHPALKHKWRGYDSATGTTTAAGNWFDPVYNAAFPADSDQHGTHVMGTMLGQEQDGGNKIGMAPGAKWIAARVFNTEGSTTDAILLSAAEWMLHPNGDPNLAPDVVNNSWGGGAGIDDWYRDAVRNWRAAGIFPAFAAGNQRVGEPAPWPGSISCPSNYPESFAVAATDKSDIRASFSKLGPSPYDPDEIKPNISAPGASIRSSIPGGYEGGWGGTSMSTPAVSGIVALLLSANSSLSVEDLEEIISTTARPLKDSTYPSSPNFAYGYGMVDAFEAVSSVASGTGFIAGKVLRDGEDMEDAVIIHEQEVTEAYAGTDIDIIAQISDDIAVTEVELLVKQQGKSYWLLIPTNRISGDHKDGMYKGTITYDMLQGNSLVYKIRVRDYAGEAVVSQDYKINVKFGIVPGEYTQGFEENASGWTFNGAWEWGKPSGLSPQPFEGENLAGTTLSGNYPNNLDSWMITPPIDLRDATLETATLRFHQWYANQYDYGTILISNDYGDTWTRVGPQYVGDAKSWREVVLNLEDHIGSTEPIFVAFRFISNASVQNLGWYIDNVRLEGVDQEALSEPVDPTAEVEEKFIAPEANFNLKRAETNNYATVEDVEVANTTMARGTGIPVADAIVTVLENGRSVKTDSITGKFSMRHPMGDGFTLRAEAYGYYSKDITVDVIEDQTTNARFVLEEKAKGTITGRVFDRYYNTPAANAVVRVVEDAKVAPVTADADGNFTIPNVYEGTYTLKVVADGFEPGEATVDVVGNEIANLEIPVKRFVGYEDEIIYDDGTGENALVLNGVGYGLAVRFTPTQYGKVKGTNVYFWDNSWPTPGGNKIGFNIYSTDENGIPTKVGEPIFVDIVRGEFNYIDLSSFGFSTDRDFYISTIQDAAGTSCPGTGIDEASPYGDRSYLNLDGTFETLADNETEGGLMMRAVMEYSVSVPTITNLEETSYTNQDSITVEGIVAAEGKVNVYVNNVKVTSVDSQNKKFTARVDLPLAENTIMVTAEMEGIETEPSIPVKVIKDKSAPVLVVDEPLNNAKVNVEVVHVRGNVTEDIKLAKLEINEKEIKVDETGNFHERLMLDPGQNTITVKATDGAGNETTVVRTVTVELEAPAITNILPDQDVNLRAGDTLTVSFNAPTGGSGYFRILMPFGLESNEIGIPMTEVDGQYTGTWTVPARLVATGLRVQVVYVSEYGFKITETAAGRVTVIGNIADLVTNTVIIGDEAFDIDYLNTNARAQAELMKWYNSNGDVYTKLNDDTIVDQEGQSISITELPNTITYFNISGDITYYEK